MRKLPFALACLSVCFSTSFLKAAPPLFPESIPADHPPFCRVNAPVVEQRLAALKAAVQFAAPISAATYTVIVVRVDFSDYPMTKTQAQADAFMANFRSFHLENSFGLISVNATTTGSGAGRQGAFRMPSILAYYAEGLSSKYAELAKDAVAVATTAGVSFTGYDHIMIYHAGEGSETGTVSQSADRIWSAYAPSSFLGGPTVGAKVFPGATFVPETEFLSVDPLGVICHEYAHQLGAVDLYNTETGLTKVGSWSLMDAGVYLGSPQGSNPAHMDAWHKLFLGLSAPETITLANNAAKTLTQAETSRTSFLRLPITVSSVGGENEYFLLEYRRTSASNGVNFDRSLDASGLLIWHVDDSIAANATRVANNNVNNGTPNMGVDLVEADSTEPSSGDPSDPTDPWPGTLVTFQNAKSRAFNGNESGISVSDVSTGGSASISMKVNATIAAVTSAEAVAVGGGADGYTNPAKGDLARITLRPAASGTIDLKIYTLGGDLVYETTVQGTAGISQTPTWNAKNSDGKTVASGIYVLHVEGGGIDSTKKIAIIK